MAMVPKRQLMIKLLANRFEKDGGNTLFQLLSDPEKASLNTVETTAPRPDLLLPKSAQVLLEQHYSWLLDPISTFPSPLKELIIRALPSRIRTRICDVLSITINEKPIPASIRHHLLHKLFKKMQLERRPKLELLEPAAFSFLLDSSKSELVRLTEFLGVQELAESLRTTVYKEIVQKAFSSLDKSANKFLQYCLSQKPKAHLSQRIALEKWDGKPETLHKIIMLRGLKKLGIALSGQPSSFLWVLIRKFDKGRGQLLKKHLHKEAIPNATPFFMEEVKKIHTIITTKSRS